MPPSRSGSTGILCPFLVLPERLCRPLAYFFICIISKWKILGRALHYGNTVSIHPGLTRRGGGKHSLDFFLDPLTPGFGSWLIVDSGDLNHQVTPLQDKTKHERLHTYNGAIWSSDLLN